jgi:hypothetical protein
MPKTRAQLVINAKPAIDVGSPADSPSVVIDFAPPALPQPLAPSNLQLTSGTEFSTASLSARVTATWDAPPGVQPRSYIAQISESNTFPAIGTLTLSTRGDERSVDFGGQRPGITQYVRVAAVAQTQGAYTAAVSIAAALDTTPAAQPTGLAASWVGTGDLLITWLNPSNLNFLEVELKIYTASGGVLLRTENRQGGSFLYQVHLNLYDTGGAGDFSLYIEARSRTYSNVLNTTSPPTLSTTKPAPATPSSVAHSWSGEADHAGVAPADWVLTWTRSDTAARYRVTIDSVAYLVSGQADQFAYPLALNRSQHSGTPDPILSYAIVALDAFGQASTAVSGTATNEDPPAPTITITQGAMGGLYATIGGTLASDFVAYEIVWKRDGTTVATVESAAANQRYEQQGKGRSRLDRSAGTGRRNRTHGSRWSR